MKSSLKRAKELLEFVKQLVFKELDKMGTSHEYYSLRIVNEVVVEGLRKIASDIFNGVMSREEYPDALAKLAKHAACEAVNFACKEI